MAVSNSNTINDPNRISFTAGRVAAFKCPDGQKEAFLWDTKTPNLGIRAYASGRKSYVFQGTVNGRTRRSTIGPVSSFDIDAARSEANRLEVLASQNISPTKDKREKAKAEHEDEIQFKRGQVTFGQVWTEYVEANRKGWGDKHYQDHIKFVRPAGLPCAIGARLSVAGALWPLVDVKLSDLTPELVKSWLVKENKTRAGVAAHGYRLLFACLNWVAEQPSYEGLIDVVKLKTKAVKKSVTKLKPRTDVLQREQLPVFFQEVNRIANPVISAYVQALLLTGARRNELMALKWGDVDFQWSSLAIRDKATSKGQEAGLRVIPLTPYVASLLYRLPRRNEWVFSSPNSQSGRLTEPRKSFEPAMAAAGIEGLTFHGLRRSFSTLSEWVEVPVGVVAQIMGHKPSATAEKHYKQRPLDLLRVWHERIEAWFLHEVGINAPPRAEKRLTVVKGA